MKKTFTILGVVALFATSNAQVVINEIYTGGGTAVATSVYKYDFIELKNIGTTSVTLTDAYIQYTSKTGVFTSANSHVIPTITLAPGQSYLIQEGNAGSKGADLPVTPDLVGNLALATITGKVALTSNATVLTSPTDTNVLDFVGYGITANQFEGASYAPAPSNALSISRTSGDTNNNSADFATGTPSPQNFSGATLGISDVKNVKSLFVKNTLVKNDEIIFGENVDHVKIYGMSGQLVKTIVSSKTNSINVSDLPKGNYIVTGTIDNQSVSQKIMKD
ncbi:lamin tail domain-containing protein [Chryseobacterium terrae]|uniref:Lamin tail domain-containing protein n=1 Tax=Chryseobacterium terrae TaxID=3163299 RepID=A0ABW8Y3E6_9FLAO